MSVITSKKKALLSMLKKNNSFLFQTKSKRLFLSRALKPTLPFLIVLVCLFTNCGYRSVLSSSSQPLKIYVDKIPDDLDGLYRRELMQEVCRTPGLELSYEKKEAFVLKIGQWSLTSDDLGYQFDRTPITGALINRLVPNEGMWRLQATLYLEKNNKAVMDPIEFECFQNYDFVDSDSLDDLAFVNSSGEVVSGLQFSLGQLDARQGAMEGSQKPLRKRFAQKVMSQLSAALLMQEIQETSKPFSN